MHHESGCCGQRVYRMPAGGVLMPMHHQVPNSRLTHLQLFGFMLDLFSAASTVLQLACSTTSGAPRPTMARALTSMNSWSAPAQRPDPVATGHLMGL